jgi:hypothetical protein
MDGGGSSCDRHHRRGLWGTCLLLPMTNAYHTPAMTLGNAVAARGRLIVWCLIAATRIRNKGGGHATAFLDYSSACRRRLLASRNSLHKNLATEQVVPCGPYDIGPSGVGAMLERGCIDDYGRQGYVRVPGPNSK